MYVKNSTAETTGVEEGESHTLGQDHELKMLCPQPGVEDQDLPALEDLECKICYQRYNAHHRRPKILNCLHRVCSRCLMRILDTVDGGGGDGGSVSCPFCRHRTEVGEHEVSALPDDANVMSHLARSWSSDHNREVVLTPRSLSSSPGPLSRRDSSNCLVITILEVQGDASPPPSSPSSPSSDVHGERSPDRANATEEEEEDAIPKFCHRVPRVLVWLLGFFYFGSLPLGIYLLVIQRVTLGVVSVSLVPSSLTVCLVYGFCQCLCQGMCDRSSRG